MPRFDVSGASLYYEVHGEGPWLVFVHGAGGNALSWWQQVPVFARRHRCLIYDQRGWGRSRCDGEPHPADFASDLTALLDHLGVERAALVGQSMGGWTVVGGTLARPGRVSHLVLTGTLGGLTDDEMLAKLSAHHANSGGGFDPHKALAPDFPAREPALTLLYDQISGLNPPIGPSFLLELISLRYTDRIAALTMPVLFVGGVHDQLFPLDLVRAAHAKVPGARLAVLSSAGHSAYFECAAELNRELGTFLNFEF